MFSSDVACLLKPAVYAKACLWLSLCLHCEELFAWPSCTVPFAKCHLRLEPAFFINHPEMLSDSHINHKYMSLLNGAGGEFMELVVKVLDLKCLSCVSEEKHGVKRNNMQTLCRKASVWDLMLIHLAMRKHDLIFIWSAPYRGPPPLTHNEEANYIFGNESDFHGKLLSTEKFTFFFYPYKNTVII